MDRYDFLVKKTADKLFYLEGDEFEKKTCIILEFINKIKLTIIQANVQGGGSGDGGVDYFDGTGTVFSVYGAKTCSTGEGKNIKRKMKNDFNKIKENRLKFTINKRHFVFNRSFGGEHKTLYDGFVSDKQKGFTIGEFYDVNKIANDIVKIREGLQLLVQIGILEDIDTIGLKDTTIEELSDDNRTMSNDKINDLFNSQSIEAQIDNNILPLIQNDIPNAENFRLDYLRNYIPISLDGGIISKKLPEIEKLYRENINQDKRKINKDYKNLEDFENFLTYNFENNKDVFRRIDKNEQIIVPYLFQGPGQKIGCFYQQTVNGFYNFEKGIEEDSIKLQVLNDNSNKPNDTISG